MNSAALKKMRDMGLTLDQAIELFEVMEEGFALPVVAMDPVSERKRARDAARMARKREEERQSRDVASDSRPDPALSLSPPPQTPPPHTHTHPEVSTRTRGAADSVDFQRFWTAYPNKSAKDTARKAFANASRRCDLETMLAAIEAQRTWDQWQRGFVPHAASWLNAGRWQDEPPPTPVIQLNQAKPNVPGPDPKLAAKDANLARAFAGADAAAEFLAERRRSGF